MFLDADDEYSENYVCEMLQEIEREKLLIAVTKIFNKDKLITEYTSKKYMDIKELIKYPCSFHPFMRGVNLRNINTFQVKTYII